MTRGFPPTAVSHVVQARPEHWPEPNYHDPPTKGEVLVVVNMVCLALAVIFCALRLYARLVVSKWFGSDDIFILFALLFTIGMAASFHIATTRFGYNRHIWDVPPAIVAKSGKLKYLHNIIFILAANATHVSWLCYYYRLVQHSRIEWFRKLLHISIASITSLFAIFLGLAVKLCAPIKAMWAFPPIQDASCLRKGEITLSGGVIKTLIDILLILIPIPLILSLNMARSRKISVFCLLSLGGAVTIAGGFRIHSIWQMYFKSDDRTWIGGSATFASALELDFGVICACLPPLRPLFGPVFERVADNIASNISWQVYKFKNHTNRHSPPGPEQPSPPVKPEPQPVEKSSNGNDATASIESPKKDELS